MTTRLEFIRIYRDTLDTLTHVRGKEEGKRDFSPGHLVCLQSLNVSTPKLRVKVVKSQRIKEKQRFYLYYCYRVSW